MENNNTKANKSKLIDNPIINVLFCILSILLEEFFIAFFPVIIICVVCFITSSVYPDFSIYNNLFVGLCTISAGNILYLIKQRAKNKSEFQNTLIVISFVSFSIALICCCCYANADMGYIRITPNIDSQKVMICILLLTIPIEILKIADRIKTSKDKTDVIREINIVKESK